MKANRLWIAALAASAFSIVSLVTQEAKAMSFTLDFTDNSLFTQFTSLPSVNNVDLGAVTVDVNASDRGGDSRNLNFTGSGVGILGNGSATINGDSGIGDDEILGLTFSEAVKFTSIGFTRLDGNDNFTLRIDGSLFGSVNTAIPSNPFTLDTGFGNLFEIAALGANDNFRLASITGEVIPTPALLPGLLGLGSAALRRRRRETADV